MERFKLTFLTSMPFAYKMETLTLSFADVSKNPVTNIDILAE